MKFQLFAFIVLLVFVLVSGSPFDDAFNGDDRRLGICRALGQPCSSIRRCCTGSTCRIPAESRLGTCRSIVSASAPPTPAPSPTPSPTPTPTSTPPRPPCLPPGSTVDSCNNSSCCGPCRPDANGGGTCLFPVG